jgi:hypothetical protein
MDKGSRTVNPFFVTNIESRDDINLLRRRTATARTASWDRRPRRALQNSADPARRRDLDVHLPTPEPDGVGKMRRGASGPIQPLSNYSRRSTRIWTGTR